MFNPDYYCTKDMSLCEASTDSKYQSVDVSFTSRNFSENPHELLLCGLSKDYARDRYELKSATKNLINNSILNITPIKKILNVYKKCISVDSWGNYLKSMFDECDEENAETKKCLDIKKKCEHFNTIMEKMTKGYESYKKIEKLFQQDVCDTIDYSTVKPLVSILMNLNYSCDSLRFIFSGESTEIKFRKKETVFSLEFFYDTEDRVIMSALKDGVYRIREFKENEYDTIRDYIDVL